MTEKPEEYITKPPKFKMLIRKFLDVVCFLLGPFLAATGVASFLPSYGSDERHFAFALGISLICFGFLRIYWRKIYL